jgi:hypothetical protein
MLKVLMVPTWSNDLLVCSWWLICYSCPPSYFQLFMLFIITSSFLKPSTLPPGSVSFLSASHITVFSSAFWLFVCTFTASKYCVVTGLLSLPCWFYLFSNLLQVYWSLYSSFDVQPVSSAQHDLSIWLSDLNLLFMPMFCYKTILLKSSACQQMTIPLVTQGIQAKHLGVI